MDEVMKKEIESISLPSPYEKQTHKVEAFGEYLDLELEFYYFTDKETNKIARLFFWKPKGARLDYSKAVSPKVWESQQETYRKCDEEATINNGRNS